MFDMSDTSIAEDLIVIFIEKVILPYCRSDYYVDWRINLYIQLHTGRPTYDWVQHPCGQLLPPILAHSVRW